MSDTGTIPRRIDYRRAAFDRADLAGVLTLSALPRTQAVCVERHETDVAVEMGFEEDAQRRVIVEGRASAYLKLPCQRCLEAADVALDIPIRGMAVADDTAAARVPRDWEPMLADGQMLDLHALVDDELLLALPITVRCDRQSCRTAYEEDREQGAPVEDVPDSEKRNPFAALAALKADNSDETD